MATQARRALSTLPEAVPERARKRARLARRTGAAAMALLVAAGGLGLLGVRTSTVSARGGGYTLEVRYPRVARPGLAAPWSVTVVRAGGFAGPVTIAASSAFLALFDANALDPDPSSSTQTRDRVLWTFEPPPGDTLVVSFDARVEPGVQWGAQGEVAVVEAGRDVVRATYRMWVMP